jgi:hypothetical protein
MMPFTGSCHCGAVAYEVDEDPPRKAMACNCSICRRQAALHHFTTPDKFALKGSRDALSTYFFNRHAIAHHFCTTCGCTPFAEGKTPDGKAMVEINLRCADGIDPDTLELSYYDGAAT